MHVHMLSGRFIAVSQLPIMDTPIFIVLHLFAIR